MSVADAPLVVLLVDDDLEIRAFLEMALQDEGYRVEAAADGRAALDRLQTMRPGGADVILLDINMPVMDGVQFARAYRETAVPPPHAAIIVMTAAADVSKRCEEAGAQGCLRKPFDLDRLLELVERHAPPHAA